MDPLSNELLPLRISPPWEVVAAIVHQADPETLKALSLVSHDFHVETASTLCRVISICALSLESNGVDNFPLKRVRDATATLQTHSRLQHIRRVRFRLCASLGGPGDSSVEEGLGGLFTAFQGIKNIEVLELDILFHQLAIARCLNEIPLPRGLRQIEIWSLGPIIVSLRAEFWDRHREQLTSLTLLTAGPAEFEADTKKVSFPALEHLYIHEPELIQYFQLPLAKTLRSLAINQIRLQDIEAFEATISVVHPEPLCPRFHPPCLSFRAPTYIYNASPIEEFSFGFTSLEHIPDPSIVYTTILTHMPRLRKLVARHGIFHCTRAVMRASNALVMNNKNLEELHLVLPPWTIHDPLPSLLDAKAFLQQAVSEDDAFAVAGSEAATGDFEREARLLMVVGEKSTTIAKFARLAMALKECRSLTRLSLFCGEMGGGTPDLNETSDLPPIVLVRNGLNMSWRVAA